LELMSSTPDLAGRVAIVTGASSGLGERFASVLVAAGAAVVAAARRRDRLADLAQRHPGITPHVADLLDDDDRMRLVEATVERHGRVDILVNNAGMGSVGPAIDQPISTIRRVIELNVVAVLDLARLVARPMIAARCGTIINVSSMLGTVAAMPFPDAAYCAAKSGVNGLTRELACQWARQGVRVNALAPGYFPSEMTEGIGDDDGGGGYIRRNSPMGRMGAPYELDGALLFLASDASSYVTGQVLTVDGGWTAR
jgi:NAD(P)-dependent dehydrogenase (short-subunit alcohol dehydrogenase family)